MLTKNKLHACKHIFLDLGGVLFYDEYVLLKFYYTAFCLINKEKKIALNDFFLAREKLFVQYKNDWIRIYLKTTLDINKMESIIAESWNGVIKNFSNLFILYPTAQKFLSDLKKKYKLYVVANQPREAKNVLENLGLYNYFEKVYIDSIIGFSKPDLEFYKYALRDSGAITNETIHIGDRLDNDIIPALKLQILPIKLKLPVQKVIMEDLDQEFVEKFYTSIRKIWHRIVEDQSANYAVAHSHEELVQALT
jgi:HAD superfamily hydrolase (TIGR01549 family)